MDSGGCSWDIGASTSPMAGLGTIGDHLAVSKLNLCMSLSLPVLLEPPKMTIELSSMTQAWKLREHGCFTASLSILACRH